MQKIHFIGICGISMSSLAQILKAKGYTVTGSDLRENEMSRHLKSVGIPVMIGQKAENIADDLDTVVYTAAIHEDNPELIEARKKCGHVIERSELLGEIIDQFENPIGIAGTHGKTSTSSMLASIFVEDGDDPTVSIGGIVERFDSNFHIGNSPYFIYEACEYADSFLHFRSKTNIITNIEAEHLDYFGTLERIEASFVRFSEIMREDGTLVIGQPLKELYKNYTGRIITVSLDDPSADYTVSGMTPLEEGPGSSFVLLHHGEPVGTLSLHVPGRHYIYDAALAAACAISEGICFLSIQRGIASYRPTKKRFEYKGEVGGCMVIDDYAHHPTEIRATLQAASEVPHRELYVVFQSHTYSRTKAFLGDFIEALSRADHVILMDIYAAREPDLHEVHARDILDGLLARGTDAYYIPEPEEIEKFLLKKISTGDMLITMGAGNAVEIADSLLSEKKSTLST